MSKVELDVWPDMKLAARPVRLPVINEYVEAGDCAENPNRCEECPLHKSPCPGCNSLYLGVCYMARTSGGESACSTCSFGHGKEQYKTPGVCCKSPLRDFAVAFIKRWWEAPIHHTADRWMHGNVGNILVARWSVTKTGDKWDAYSIRLRELVGRRKAVPTREKCFIGRTGIPEGKSVVALSVGSDEWVEKQGEMPLPEHMRRMGVTHWTPHIWSVYVNHGRMNILFNLARIRRSLIQTQAHFVPLCTGIGLGGFLAPWYAGMLRSVPNLFLDLSHEVGNENIKRCVEVLQELVRLRIKPISLLVTGIGEKREQIREGLRKQFPKWHWSFADIVIPPEVEAQRRAKKGGKSAG